MADFPKSNDPAFLEQNAHQSSQPQFPESLLNQILSSLPEGKLSRTLQLYFEKSILKLIWNKAVEVKMEKVTLTEWGRFLNELQFNQLQMYLDFDDSRKEKEEKLFEDLLLNTALIINTKKYESVLKFILTHAHS